MRAFMTHLGIQIQMDIRNRGTLLTYYIIPIVFYCVMGAVFSSIQPQSRQTLSASMSLFAITMGAVLGMPPGLVKMRESGTLRAYRVSGVPNWAVLSTSSLSAFVHLFIVSILIYLSAPVFFGASLPGNAGSYLLCIVLFILASISLGNLIGVLAKSQAMATILSQAVFLPSLLLGGLMFPSSMLPKALQILGQLFPATHAMKAISGLSYRAGSAAEALVSVAVIAAICLVATALGLMRFKKVSKAA